MSRLIFLLILFTYSAAVAAEDELEQLKEVTERSEFTALKDTVVGHIKSKFTPTTEVIYDYKTDDRPCQHCPEYLELTSEVNKIIERMPLEKTSPGNYNDAILKLNKLKFMYYEVKSGMENGGIQCVQYANTDPRNIQLTANDNTRLLAEEMLDLPNVTSFQYYPKGNQKEIKYYYRGEGMQADIMVEVTIYPDRTAMVRYYRMKDFRVEEKVLNKKEISNRDQSLSVKAISQDLKFQKTDEKEIELNDDITLDADPDLKLKQQKLAVSLKKNSTGKEWVKLDLEHNTMKDVGISTYIPIEMKLNEGSLKLGGNVGMSKTSTYQGEVTEDTKSVQLALTDRNHEYIRASIVSQHELDQMTFSSKYDMGKFGHIKGSVFRDTEGKKEYSMAHGFTGDNSVTTTRVGMTADAKKFLELQREQKIGKSQSMVLTFRTDEDKDVSIMYQYQIRMP